MAACLPEQFMWTRSASPPSRSSRRIACSSSGRAGGQPRASSSSPAPARISRTPVTWNTSPEWLAAASASSLPSRSSPARTMPTACIGLFAERGNAAAAVSPARSTAWPSGPSTTTEPRWRDSAKPDRTTSARITGFSVTAVHPQQGAGLVRPHRRALRQLGQGRPARDEFGVARDQVTVDMAAVRLAKIAQQPVQRRHVTEVEELELGHYPPLLGPRVEVTDERPRVAEHLVPE